MKKTKLTKKEIIIKSVMLAFYPIVWLSCIAYFWCNRENVDAMGYALIVIWFLIPLTTLVSSFFIGLKNYFGKLKFVLPVFYGLAYMLLPYLTFSLANTLRSGNVNTPEGVLVAVGLMISAFGMTVGWLFDR